MPFIALSLPPKMRADMAAACTYCTAVALTELPAGFVSFQRQQPGFPPIKKDHSAATSLTTAVQFSGNYANYAKNAVTTAICESL